MIKISIVEDRIEIRNSLVRGINRTNDIECIGNYSSAEEALNQIPKNIPELVLMDVGLPKMNGIECLLRLKAEHEDLDFLMFTVFDNGELVFEALKAGASGYILKEEGVQGVVNAIREFKAGGAPMSRSIAKSVLASFSKKTIDKTKHFENLTNQQLKILEYLATGLLNKEIADRLGITERTVKQHNSTIYKKLQVNNRTEAAKIYLGTNDH